MMPQPLPPRPRPHRTDQIHDWIIANSANLLSRYSIFLDLDGTLIEFSEDPANVPADPELSALLQHAATVLGGALALVSGRSLVALDAILTPLCLPASGIYGLERRDHRGILHLKAANPRALDPAREIIADFTAACPGVIAEDKGTAVALHFRRAPAYGADCRLIVNAVASELWPLFQVVEGSMVVEITPAGANKGTSIEEFLLEPPFAGRIPIVLGDDSSDYDAFDVVHRHGGFSLVVGSRIIGDYRLDNCLAARRWLSALVGIGNR